MTTLEQKFNIIKTLDTWRWEQDEKGSGDKFYRFEIESYPFYDEYKNASEKGIISKELAKKILFAHYLLYICDRQMDYRFIFKYGGYVVAKIMENFINEFTYEPNIIKEAFMDFIDRYTYTLPKEKNGDVLSTAVYSHYLKAEEPENNKLRKDFKSKYKKILDDNQELNGYVVFASRMTINDYYCIFRTLKNIKKFFKALDESADINTLAQKLYECTYQSVKSKIKNISGKNYDSFAKVYKDYDGELDKSKSFDSKRRYSSKRLWCVIRDYMYNPLFKKCFQIYIGENRFNELYKDVENIELPGDVWNNNTRFKECFWYNKKEEDVDKKNGKYNSSKAIRNKYKNKKDIWNECLPVHFDITFNFVPRMCNILNCGICPLNSEEIRWEDKICHKKEGQYCTLALFSAGIKHKCTGANACPIVQKSISAGGSPDHE